MIMSIAILGAGVMGEALLSGLVRSGLDPASITITDPRSERLTELTAKFGVKSSDN